MENNKVIELLKNYRSYEYASRNCGEPTYTPLLLSERRRDPNNWDASRYTRIVNIIEGAVNQVLSDDQRTIINRKYLDKNTLTLNQIANILHKDRSTIGNWHKEAINRLSIAMEPLTESEREITAFDHMFDQDWTYQEPA